MIKVHHLENSQSLRILWLLEELGTDYEIERYGRTGPNTTAPEAYKQLHPLGTSPTISDGPLVMAETSAIIDYILDQHGPSPLRPDVGSGSRNRYIFWLHATQGSLMPMLLFKLIIDRIVSKVPFFLRPVLSGVREKVLNTLIRPRTDRILAYAEEELGRTTWLAGNDLTAADIVMGYCLEVAELRYGFDGKYPNLIAFIDRMRERPAYREAIRKGGAFKPLAD